MEYLVIIWSINYWENNNTKKYPSQIVLTILLYK